MQSMHDEFEKEEFLLDDPEAEEEVANDELEDEDEDSGEDEEDL